MKGFENGTRVPEADFEVERNPYAEATRELRKGVMSNMKDISPSLRKSAIERMLMGPEFPSPDPVLEPIFEQIAAVEEKYGQETVAELAAFYSFKPESLDA